MNASSETEPANAILITGPKGEPISRIGKRMIYSIKPKMVTARLAIRRFLADFVSMDDPIAPRAARLISAFMNSRKSEASLKAVVAFGTRPAYKISSSTRPNEIVASQAYDPTIMDFIAAVVIL